MKSDEKNEELKQALEESLMEQIRMVPPKEQLEKEFVFSKSFEHEMDVLMKKRKRKKGFWTVKAAACVVLFLIAGYGFRFFQTDDTSDYTKFASQTDDLKVKEKKDSVVQEDNTTVASNDNNQNYDKILEGEDELTIQVDGNDQDKDVLESNKQKKEEIADNKMNETEENTKQEIGMAEDNTNISKASTGENKQLSVVSHLISAVMEGDSVKIVLQVENGTDTNIICEQTESLQIMEDENWIEVSNSEGDISDEEKEVLPGEEYVNTILLTGFSLEKGEQYKIIKKINGDKKEFEFNL